MARLVLGPLLRHVSATSATVWIEADAPCTVEVLGHSARTFAAFGHHYALVDVVDLDRGSTTPYTIALDGERCWPEDDSPYPASVIRTLGEGSLELAFGSCRVAAPHEPPYTESHGIDALYALAERLRETPSEFWPDALLMLGDQVYADALSPATRAFITERRSVSEPPFHEVADFEEYTRLYWETWGAPAVRWLLANLPTAMIFDDHDIHDDWNTSAAWCADMAEKAWWPERITSGLMSYWVYQHLGNLSPQGRATDELYQRALATDDATAALHEFAVHAGATTDGSRWSYSWELGTSRLIVIDSRAGRVLKGGKREMLDDDEWNFVEREMRTPADHLLLATSLPYLLPPAIHSLEAWNEAVCAGAWGRFAARVGEQIRRRVDLEHWAAFERSFRRLTDLICSAATGAHGHAPASVVVLSGDVHYAYLARADVGARSAPVYQAVCSPLRNALPETVKRATRVTISRRAAGVGRWLARSAGVAPPAIDWEIDAGPFFDNQLATLTLEQREATLRLERARLANDTPYLEPVWQRRLTPEEL